MMSEFEFVIQPLEAKKKKIQPNSDKKHSLKKTQFLQKLSQKLT